MELPSAGRSMIEDAFRSNRRIHYLGFRRRFHADALFQKELNRAAFIHQIVRFLTPYRRSDRLKGRKASAGYAQV